MATRWAHGVKEKLSTLTSGVRLVDISNSSEMFRQGFDVYQVGKTTGRGSEAIDYCSLRYLSQCAFEKQNM
jgi:hypothetical protein